MPGYCFKHNKFLEYGYKRGYAFKYFNKKGYLKASNGDILYCLECLQENEVDIFGADLFNQKTADIK